MTRNTLWQLLLGRKGCDKMAKPTLADFLAYYKERKLILRVAFEKYLMLNPEIKEELANGESRQRKNKA